MKMVPTSAFSPACEICGRTFFSANECSVHERKCREIEQERERRKKDMKNCPICYGFGYLVEEYNREVWKDSFIGGGYDLVRDTRRVPCPRCSPYYYY